MDHFLIYTDIVVLIIAILMAYACTLQLSKIALLPVRRLPLFFLLLGATTVIAYMSEHSGEIMYGAIQQVLADTFVYDFGFYSWNLMSMMFLAIGMYMIVQVKEWVSGDLKAKGTLLKAALGVILLSVPTFPFTFVCLFPTIACLIALVAIPFTIHVAERKLQKI